MNQHPIRIQILRNLSFANSLTYTGLKRGLDIENNKFTFHLNELVRLEHVVKTGMLYSLSDTGKEYISRVDMHRLAVIKQAKVSVWICCTRDSGAEKEFLVYTRLKHPFYGCQGFMSSKVPYGTRVLDAAQQGLKEKTGLTGTAKIVELKHYRVYSKVSRALLEDKLMFLVLVADPTGDLELNNEGAFEWVLRSELETYIANPFENTDALKKQVEDIESFTGNMNFTEVDHWSDKF